MGNIRQLWQQAKKEFKTKIGRTIKRTVQYYEETCYGTVCAINHKGKIIKVIDGTLLED